METKELMAMTSLSSASGLLPEPPMAKPKWMLKTKEPIDVVPRGQLPGTVHRVEEKEYLVLFKPFALHNPPCPDEESMSTMDMQNPMSY